MPHSIETLVRHLRLRKGRERRGLALAEGVRLVEEVVAAGIPIRAVLLAPALEATPRGSALAEALRARCQRVEVCDDRALAALAATEHPQGVVAVIEPRRWVLSDVPVTGTILVLDAVQDPGNVGTMIRTAWALGADGVVALPGTADLTNPKVLRATMGASFRLPAVQAGVEESLAWLARHAVEIWVAASDGAPVQSARPEGPLAVVLGNEGAGVGAAFTAAAHRRVSVPLRPGAESLNVAVAAGILLHEVRRDP